MCDEKEKNRISEIASFQKALSSCYEENAAMCDSKGRKDKLMKILCEEEDLLFELHGEMKKREWGISQQASPEKVAHVCLKFKHQEKRRENELRNILKEHVFRSFLWIEEKEV